MDADLSIRKRSRYWIGALVGVAVFCVVLIWFVWRVQSTRSVINTSNAARVRVGMSLAEVETVFGGPAPFRLGTGLVPGNFRNTETWSSRRVSVVVDFGDDGHVTRVAIHPQQVDDEDCFDQLGLLLDDFGS